MWGYGWNVFDLFLAIISVIEEVTIIMGAMGGAMPANSILLRVVRLLRVVKVVRVMRLMRYFEDLRLLVSCIMHSAKPFFWAAALILLLIYVVGTYLTYIISVKRISDELASSDLSELKSYYGSVGRSVLSLFQGLTGGIDWRDLLDPLLEEPSLQWAAAGTLVYLAFAILGVMNVVTATFVQNAIERSQEVKEINRVSQARKLFKCLDFDDSGAISFEEIHDHLHTPAVQDFLKSIDVDVSEARCLFEVMDMSGNGTIDFEEFLSACLRLQGPARALDLILLTRDSRRFFEQQALLLEQLTAQQQQQHQQQEQQPQPQLQEEQRQRRDQLLAPGPGFSPCSASPPMGRVSATEVAAAVVPTKAGVIGELRVPLPHAPVRSALRAKSVPLGALSSESDEGDNPEEGSAESC
jgi:hypothetical protein